MTFAVQCPDKEGMTQRLLTKVKKLEKKYKFRTCSFRIDNEIANTVEFKDHCLCKGITVESIVPHTHYQNGVAKCNICTLRERTAAIIQHTRLPDSIVQTFDARIQEFLRNSQVPERLWPEAVRHAVWSKNRLPTRVHKTGKTPFELMTGY